MCLADRPNNQAAITIGQEWIKGEPHVSHRRTELPEPQEPSKPFSLWQVLKDLVGKDILDAPLPIQQYCPLSELQFRAEAELEYTELLDQAAALPKGSIDRLLLVGACAQTGFSAGLRPFKCFNPVMGETFEVVRADRGMRALFEAVHQDFRSGARYVNAWHAEGAAWTMSGEDEPRVRFWGTSIDMHLHWNVALTFADGEAFSWRKGSSNISGLTSGNLVITHKGTLSIASHMSGTVHLTFKEPGMFSGLSSKKASKHQMTGYVERDGVKLSAPTISGNFDSRLVATMEDGSQRTIWEKRYPAKGLDRYHFAEWTVQLNELTQGQRGRLPPTDSRLRPDTRALEEGRFAQANSLKRELSERVKQQTIDEQRGGCIIQPRWFALRQPGCLGTRAPSASGRDALRFRFTGEYWQARKTGAWESVPRLFSQEK